MKAYWTLRNHCGLYFLKSRQKLWNITASTLQCLLHLIAHQLFCKTTVLQETSMVPTPLHQHYRFNIWTRRLAIFGLNVTYDGGTFNCCLLLYLPLQTGRWSRMVAKFCIGDDRAGVHFVRHIFEFGTIFTRYFLNISYINICVQTKFIFLFSATEANVLFAGIWIPHLLSSFACHALLWSLCFLFKDVAVVQGVTLLVLHCWKSSLLLDQILVILNGTTNVKCWSQRWYIFHLNLNKPEDNFRSINVITDHWWGDYFSSHFASTSHFWRK